MKRGIITIVLLLATVSSFAEDKGDEKRLSNSPDSGTKEKSTRQEIVKEKKSPAWPRPYKATEEISVDSTVPFPTDI